ncbi:hypothetical protein BCR42DRAFT_419331 [Absidia repens]|uniref:Uncharacterized protein n=1 Tax=Absidia repens TaxID=90262 RepID=A0A1X2IB58_9FUNG|nr:hypothetical protein BCR42DRAFT_419331 [Absidia repens]
MSRQYFILFFYLVCLVLVVHGGALEDDLQLNINNINNISKPSWFYWVWHQWKVIMKMVFKIASLPILPFLWMTRWLWRHLILTPWTMAVHATHIMYPVLIYCGAACLCGLIIGGCSGFAAEAMSSAVINATWGKPTSIDKQQLLEAEDEAEEDDTETIFSQDTYDNNADETDSMYWRQASQHSPASSIYRFSISSDPFMTSSRPSSFYDDKSNDWHGNEDPEEIASILRQRRKQQQQQQQQFQSHQPL